MKISGKLICVECNSIMEWEYILPQKIGVEPLQVETLDDNKYHPVKKKRLNENEYILQLRCKECGKVNQFQYYSERYL